MLFNNNHNNIINIIDRKLSKSIMLFKWKANIIKNKTKRKLTKITLKKLIINKKLVFYIFDIDFGAFNIAFPSILLPFNHLSLSAKSWLKSNNS